MGGQAPDGELRELQQHYGLDRSYAPLELLESRAVTPAPSDVETTQQPVIPAVFPTSVSAQIGVEQPVVDFGEVVYPVLVSSASVTAAVESASVSETTGSFSAEVLSPKRLQASFIFSRESRAKFPGMEDSLRQNLQMSLSDSLDKQVIGGTDGLLTGTNLTANASAAAATFAVMQSQLIHSRVDGTFASATGDLRILLGPSTFSFAGGLYRGSGTDYSALSAVMKETAAVLVSSHVPPVASKKQNALVRLGLRRDAIAPVWQGLEIVLDQVTKAGIGEIVLSAYLMHAVKILRGGGFFKQELQVAP